MAPRWTDDHCHLGWDGDDRPDPTAADALVAEARAAGVERLVTVGTDAERSAQAVGAARRYPGTVWATVGLHPHEAVQGLDGLAELLAEPEVVAVGECGLDYHYDHSPRPVQRQAFADQVALAQAHDLALVIHTREAWDDTFAILDAEGVPERTVLHCFTGGPDEARRCLDRGMYLSFSGIVTFKAADDVRGAAALCPLDRLLVETDSPYLAPVPHRGRPNRPALVPLVGAAVAAASGAAVEAVAAATWDNAERAYRLAAPAAGPQPGGRPGRRPGVTLSPRQVRELLDENGLHPSRALGQNFVADPNTVRRIARLSGVGEGDHVVEIGPGLGSLTLALAETGASVTAVEVDRHLVPVLRRVVEPVGVRVVEGDALRLDWAEVLAEAPSWSLVANLPYNVATPLVLDLLAGVPAIERMLVMVQREVGERLAAGPGTGAYGIPSVKLALRATAEVVGRVPPTVFIPQPRVESALVQVVRHPRPAVDADPDALFRLVEAGFGQRRKMLRRSLAGLVGPEAFAAAGVDPTARAEQLSLAEWGALTRAAGPTPECGRVTP